MLKADKEKQPGSPMSLIVIVDDRVTNRTIYSKLAETIGQNVEVRAFGDPGEALDWLGQNQADLIVTDYDMPKINGDEFISRFRAMPHSAAVPIMMITVNAQRILRLRALESGATDFLNSPIDHYEFLSRARNLLKLRQGAAQAAGETKRETDGSESGATEDTAAEDSAAAETERFLAQCDEADAYALHVIEIGEGDPAQDDPAFADAAAIAEALRRQLRRDDVVARIDRRRLGILQQHVVDRADANACASRLTDPRNGAGLLRIGTSPPRADDDAPDAPAAVRLREALTLAGKGDAGLAVPAAPKSAEDIWRFQPRIDLRSSQMRGAQAFRGDDPADARDGEALRAALACASALQSSLRRPFSLGLRLRIGPSGPAAMALLLAPLLAEARVSPDWIDLQICAREALAEPARTEEEARALQALGVGLTLDLAALPPHALRGGEAWTAPLTDFMAQWRPVLKFPCGDEDAIAFGRRLRPQSGSKAANSKAAGSKATGSKAQSALLLADRVASSALLRPLLRAGVSLAQGACFGAPFSARDLQSLFELPPETDGSRLATQRA